MLRLFSAAIAVIFILILWPLIWPYVLPLLFMPDCAWFIPNYRGWAMRSMLSIASLMSVIIIVGMPNWRNIRESWKTLQVLHVWRSLLLFAVIGLCGSFYIYNVSWAGLGESSISVPRGFADARRNFIPAEALSAVSLTLQTNQYSTGHGLPRQRGTVVQQILEFTAAGKTYLTYYPADRDLSELKKILNVWTNRSFKSDSASPQR